jgi:hypothetical protein
VANITNRGVNPLVAGIAGAAIGAAAVALSNKDTRQKMGKTVKDLQDRGKGFYHDITHRTNELADKTKRAAKKAQEDVREIMNEESPTDQKTGS